MTKEKKLIIFSDLSLIAGDTVIGIIAGDWFYNHFLVSAKFYESILVFRLFCLSILIFVGLYIYALFINKKNIEVLPIRKSGDAEYSALAFNTILASMVITEIIDGLLGIENMMFFIITFFTVGVFWLWFHNKIFKSASVGQSGKVDLKKQITGIIMVFPLCIICLMPTNALTTAFLEANAGLPANDYFWMIPVFSLSLALISWMMVYIPRRMIRIISGNTYRNKYFFLYLLLSIVIKLVTGI